MRPQAQLWDPISWPELVALGPLAGACEQEGPGPACEANEMAGAGVLGPLAGGRGHLAALEAPLPDLDLEDRPAANTSKVDKQLN